MRKTLLCSLLAVVAILAKAAPNAGQPFCFWYWMYGAVEKPAIKADLVAMREAGLRGTYLMPIRSATQRPDYGGRAEQLTPTFWDCVDYALHTADSLGLEVGVHICDGFALAGGPWFTPDESMQHVVWTDTIVQIAAKKPFAIHGKAPKNAHTIAAYALPVDYAEPLIKPVAFTHSANVTSDAKNLVRANEPCWFMFELPEGAKVRNVRITPSGTNVQCLRLRVEASADGRVFTHLATFTPPRAGWQNTAAPNTFALPQTGAMKPRYLRFSWTPDGTEPGSEDLDAAKWKPTLRLKDIAFSAVPLIDQWEGKTAQAWRVSTATTADQLPAALCTPLSKVVRLDISADGSLTFPPSGGKGGLPAGRCRILTMGYASTGQTNETAGGGKGLECDKFSAAAVNKLVDNWFAKFIALPSGKAVKYLHVDSWECGCQNWSSNFAAEFQRRRGYDLLPWLPVMAGVPIESAAESERVLRDVRLTINDLLNDVFFATVQKRAHDMGMAFSSESIAPTMVADGLDHYRYADLPMGEYWLNSPTHDKPNDMLDAISGAHIYGKPIIQAEGFTEVRGVWDETPWSIKTLLDRNFALGMNRLFFHVNTHNPWLDKKPGMTLDGIGLFFQRDQTWMPEARVFVDYVTRCSALLQQGRPVQDVAVFIGEEMPRRAVLPERLVTMLPGIFGPERVASEQARLANVGQPMAESPVGVNHSAGIVDTRDWVNSLRGYQYDSFNPDALLRLAKADDGCMTLPGGAKYRAVVLPGVRPMNPALADYSPAVAAKIEELRRAGVAIIDTPWQADDFSAIGLRRDVALPSGVAYTHRSAKEGEIYFLANQTDSAMAFTATFRDTANGTPYIYDAVWNTMHNAQCTMHNEVQIELPARGSCFVLFPGEGGVEALTACLPTPPSLRVLESTPPTAATTLAAPWSLTLREAGKTRQLTELEDWSQSQDTAERFFSGHGIYTTTVKFGRPTGNERLTLGTVRDIAHVWVNGTDCGIVWTAPYETAIGHALKKGKNTIRIEVVNTWANALRGMDEGTPPYSGIWTNARYRMKSPHLLPAGLLGPVTIR